ncbi:histidinol-phosphate aminotransferase [Laetiporus sulphureus 93-53]|uniref:histidinol-phosphate transaminase n=1 Tax=Laetiporus sulphureus 93-53 TaxID=1314785 RepID=A0A165GFZ7_9APHY|nr:histidinol-phosphate aminotransferase [Laetiporus sulphureus 93-53]KZT10296.1 histidinol-phosphate aminotransferase [Laetiporus sulphureus 93-53]
MTILGLPPSLYPTSPAHFDIEKVIRPNILNLQPYRCARDDYSEGILLDANENALGHSIPQFNGDASKSAPELEPELQATLSLALHRYPSPRNDQIRERIAELRGLPGPDYVFLGVGSDEVIDLLMRVCVAPGQEKILITPPTYGMYSVCAQVNDVGVVKEPLELSGENGEGGERGRFSLRISEIKRAVAVDPTIKLIFLCSPGNPTGTLISLTALRELLEYKPFKGIVIVDEAYIDFAGGSGSAVPLIKQYANLCVMQTLSKSFGLAAIRLGMALAHPALVQILMNTRAPYNISAPTASLALSALRPSAVAAMSAKVAVLVEQRAVLLHELEKLRPLGLGAAIGGNNANFVMVPVLEKCGSGLPDNTRAHRIYKTAAEEEGVVVRYRGGELGCEGCLRITVGSAEENVVALRKLEGLLKKL